MVQSILTLFINPMLHKSISMIKALQIQETKYQSMMEWAESISMKLILLSLMIRVLEELPFPVEQKGR